MRKEAYGDASKRLAICQYGVNASARESGWGKRGREQKWQIGDDPEQQKRVWSHRGCRSNLIGAGIKVESPFFVDLGRRIGRGEDLDTDFWRELEQDELGHVLSSVGSGPCDICGLDAASGGNCAFCEDLPVREELQQQRANTALPVTMDGSWGRRHNQMPMLIGLDATGKLGKLGVSQDLSPASKVKLGLCSQLRQLDRNGHGKTLRQKMKEYIHLNRGA